MAHTPGRAAARKRLTSYGVGLLAAALGLVASRALQPLTDRSLLFLPLLATGVAAWARGRRAGVTAAAASVLAAALLLHGERPLLAWDAAEGVTVAALTAAGLLLTAVVASLGERLRRAEALDAELRAANAALERARADAEAAGRAKGDFLNLMSHELRTPLNAIGGYAELMALGITGPVTPQQADYLARVKRSQQYLLGLVNSILNLAKLEAGHVTFALAPVPLGDALATVELLVLPQCALKGLTFRRPDATPGVCVHAERERVEQILVNLLGNAVKFTPAGGEVALAWTADAARVHVTVRDTGPGVPPDKLAAIFEPFVQADVTLGAAPAGTGLGLAISRQLARGMGGDVRVENAPGRGATFTLTLPRAAA